MHLWCKILLHTLQGLSERNELSPCTLYVCIHYFVYVCIISPNHKLFQVKSSNVLTSGSLPLQKAILSLCVSLSNRLYITSKLKFQARYTLSRKLIMSRITVHIFVKVCVMMQWNACIIHERKNCAGPGHD